jgi:hypothetical protein
VKHRIVERNFPNPKLRGEEKRVKNERARKKCDADAFVMRLDRAGSVSRTLRHPETSPVVARFHRDYCSYGSEREEVDDDGISVWRGAISIFDLESLSGSQMFSLP